MGLPEGLARKGLPDEFLDANLRKWRQVPREGPRTPFPVVECRGEFHPGMARPGAVTIVLGGSPRAWFEALCSHSRCAPRVWWRLRRLARL